MGMQSSLPCPHQRVTLHPALPYSHSHSAVLCTAGVHVCIHTPVARRIHRDRLHDTSTMLPPPPHTSSVTPGHAQRIHPAHRHTGTEPRLATSHQEAVRRLPGPHTHLLMHHGSFRSGPRERGGTQDPFCVGLKALACPVHPGGRK